ncbi:hypothetical protein GCM10009127_22420 [Alteraurantiacibacter aestuarii]|uniref:MBOAT family O-acyltransferase n=1 Tax=Alteraurantiacibacter aestuarii TaxID=650004 RepID=UPI0031DC8740
MSASVVQLLALCLLAVPLSWVVPRAWALDAVALFTALAIAAFSPATVAWLLASTMLVHAAMRLGNAAQNKGLFAGMTVVLLLVGFVFSEFEHGLVWIGVSFFTLRQLHVLGDWWTGKLDPPSLRNLVRYQFFLPVMLVGPIHRYQNFERQAQRRRFDAGDLFSGLERCLIGAFMAYFIGGVVWGEVQLNLTHRLLAPEQFTTSWLLSAVSWMQLYFVFAGLTSIALGTSLMMGMKLEENFRQPWRATSLLDFWTRWHISLTDWSRDYAYRPVMALTRSPIAGVIAAMLVIGLWHELSVYYVLWSFWQALGIIGSRFAGRFLPLDRLPVPLLRLIISLGILGWLSLARPVITLLLGIADDAALSPF